MAVSPPSPTPVSARPARHGAFHSLTVAAVDRLTDDSVALTLSVPQELRAEYLHAPGQHLTLRRRGPEGTEVRRTYSICSPAPDAAGPALLRVGVRLVEGGEFSTFAHKEIAAGDVLDVMVPAGRFVLDPAAAPPPRTMRRSSVAAASPRCCRSPPRCCRPGPTPASAWCAATARPPRRCSWRRSRTSRTATRTASSW